MLYNLIHDIVLKTHRDEKIARANSAAIIVEQLAAEQDAEPTPSASESPKGPRTASTPAAVFEDGTVYLRGNPLSTTYEIRCPKCRLPKLLYPTDGVGAQAPEECVTYCKRHPYISKPYHDIYGQAFPREDTKLPRKSLNNKNPPSSQPDSSSFDSSITLTPPPGKIAKTAPSFPNVKCPNCARYSDVRSFRRHLKACMGISNRQSNRTATLKSTNSGLGSRNGSTPPGSRKGTPTLMTMKTSPLKRDRDEDLSEDDDDDDDYKDDERKGKRKKKA